MPTILLVEDNPADLTRLSTGLKQLGRFDVMTAENGQDALRVLEHHLVDLVVTDLSMPYMDGFALLSHLQGEALEIPAVVLTGLTRPGVYERLETLDALRVLQKPVHYERLAELIEEVLAELPEKPGGVSLQSLLMSIQLEGQSCSVLAASKERKGSLHFIKGDLADAYVFDTQLDGEAAAREILGWESVKLKIDPSYSGKQRFIKTPLETLLRLQPSEEAEEPEFVPRITEAEVPAEAVLLETTDEDQAPPAEADVTSQAKEADMSDVRQNLKDESDKLKDLLERLQTRAREADEALTQVLEDFEAFREQQQHYQEAESAYLKRQERLESLRSDAEALAQQLLSAVKQIDDTTDPGETKDSSEAATTA